MAQGLIDRPLAEEVRIEGQADKAAVIAQRAQLVVGQAPRVIPYRPAERVRDEHRRSVQVEHLEEAGFVDMGHVEQKRALLERLDQLPTRRLEGRCTVVVAAEPVVGLVVPGQRQAAQGVLGPERLQRLGLDARESETLRVRQHPGPGILRVQVLGGGHESERGAVRPEQFLMGLELAYQAALRTVGKQRRPHRGGV